MHGRRLPPVKAPKLILIPGGWPGRKSSSLGGLNGPLLLQTRMEKVVGYSMLRNNASGQEMRLPGWILAGLLPGKY